MHNKSMQYSVFLAATLFLSTSACLANGAVYVGAGFPGVLTLGYSEAYSDSLSWRLQYSGQTSKSKSGNFDTIPATATIKADSVAVLADWRPWRSGFRLVGGLTHNKLKADVRATGSGTATINGKIVNMNGRFYNLNIDFPDWTPYLGIGYGLGSKEKGWGFFADLGVLVGKFKVRSTNNLVGVAGITQADINAQDQKVRDDIGKLSVFPVLGIGVSYRY